ncbi:MAG: VOC family protein [Acidimicrobiia bacterium]
MARFDAIGLVVRDMSEAMDFYRKLGLEFVMGTESDGHTEAAGPNGLRVMFDTQEMMKSFSQWEPASGGHRVSLAFLCESPDEVNRLYHELTVGGAPSHVAPFDAPWGQRYATVLDPDDNAVDLFAPMS